MIRLLRSMRFTAVIILLLIVIYSLGLLLPQKWMFDSEAQYNAWLASGAMNKLLDYLGFTDIYLSPLTIALLVLFFLNLIIVMSDRIPVILRKAMIRGPIAEFTVDDIRKNDNVITVISDCKHDEAYGRIKSYLSKQRWHVYDIRLAHTFHAVKNRLSPIGFLLFHVSFIFFLIGALLITYTRFSGKLVLTEGQVFDNDIGMFYQINRDPKILKMLPSLGLLVEEVKPVYENRIPTELAVSLSVKYWDDVEKEVLRVNEPVKKGPVSIIVNNIGVSPLFVMRDPSGEEIDGAYVSLSILNGKEDHFRLDLDVPYTFRVKLFPDYFVKDGKEMTRSIEMRNPAIHLIALKGGEEVYEGTIRLREHANIGRYTISFEDLRYWVEFIIVREYGKMPLMAGFLFAAVGLVMRLVFYQKRLRLALEESGEKTILYMNGKSEYFQQSFIDEMKTVANKLEKLLRGCDDTDD